MEMVLDFETFSEADLKKVGAVEYAKHPSTEILCFAYKIDKHPAKLVWPKEGIPREFIYALCNSSVIKVAHNAGFEQAITKWVLTRYLHDRNLHQERTVIGSIPHRDWKCTAAKAAAHALPRALEGACKALGLSAQKDTVGNALIKKYCKPRKPTKKNPSTRHDDPLDLIRIGEYCLSDVEAQYELDKKLPDLSPFEQKVWELDQEINFRGIKIDVPAVEKIIDMIDEERKNLITELKEITGGAVSSPTKIQDLNRFLNKKGVVLPNMQAKTLTTYLAGDNVNPLIRRILEIRQQGGKSSVGKFSSMLDRVGDDDRARDLLMYHGASTGRWTGKGIQVTNFPRGIEGLDTGEAIDLIKDPETDPEIIRLMYGDVMPVLSSCCRGMLIPTEGHEFFDADYASIEARVLFWIAGHSDGITAFVEGRDLYKEMASVIFKRKITEKGFERELGKRAVLGCGYGMGANKFHQICADFQLFISEELAANAVKAYRGLHSPVPAMWKNLEKAALEAVKTKKKISVHKVTFFVENKFLYCQLPNGRKLAYYNPSIVSTKNKWGYVQSQLRYEAENPKTKQWERTTIWGGTWTENICQAISRDLMVYAMMNLNGSGYKPLLNVYDQILCERKYGQGDVKEYENIMAQLPPWAEGLPVIAEGEKMSRWKK